MQLRHLAAVRVVGISGGRMHGPLLDFHKKRHEREEVFSTLLVPSRPGFSLLSEPNYLRISPFCCVPPLPNFVFGVLHHGPPSLRGQPPADPAPEHGSGQESQGAHLCTPPILVAARSSRTVTTSQLDRSMDRLRWAAMGVMWIIARLLFRLTPGGELGSRWASGDDR